MEQVTMNGSDWYNEWPKITMCNKEWQRVVILAKLPILTNQPKQKSLNFQEDLLN